MKNDWIIPLESVRGSGLKREEMLDDAAFLKQLAKELHILGLDWLNYSAFITREQDGLRLKGTLKAKVTQACSLTLEPVQETVNESFNILFLPHAEDPNENFEMPEDIEAFLESDDPPEPLINNEINLYAILREFTALGLNPFPRQDGAVFSQPKEDTVISPFSALAQLQSKS